eukprot:gene2239-1741_t
MFFQAYRVSCALPPEGWTATFRKSKEQLPDGWDAKCRGAKEDAARTRPERADA